MKNNKSNARWPNKNMKYILFEISIVVPLAIWGCVCVLRQFSHNWLITTTLIVCSSLGSSVHGILQAQILELVAIPFSRGSSWPRDWTHVSHVSCNGRRVLYYWAMEEAPSIISQECALRLLGFQGWKQDNKIPLSLDLHWLIKYLPSHAVQTLTLHVYEKSVQFFSHTHHVSSAQ